MSHEKASNFIEEIIEKDLNEKKYDVIQTRFPPEPNGYLHIGHAKSICLNFGLAKKYKGKCNLRFDDTNPTTEETEYVESIKNDIQWLGFQWDKELYTSDYFQQLFDFACILIDKGLAYVDKNSSEQMAIEKGTPTTVGVASQYRNTTIEENISLFLEMKDGKHADGSMVLRAKIDMTSTNMLMRDPIIYRIKKAHHHRTKNNWCIYPMYDFAHGQSDSLEKISHSICTLEFVPHRELYDWLIKNIDIYPSHQHEFARFNLNYTVMSKRKLLQLVQENHVSSWDDPRMPTLSGMRRRGYLPESIREFCDKIGVAKRDNLIDISLLEFCVREDLNKTALRRMAVLKPLKIVITNYDEHKNEILLAENNPVDENGGHREISFSNELWIEQEDFMENPPEKFFRLGPGLKTRLKHAYIIECNKAIKNDAGEVIELRCTYFPESKSGEDKSGIKVKGVIHWVDAKTAKTAEVRLYDRLFNVENPAMEEGDFKEYINPNSFEKVETAFIEPALNKASDGEHFQFLRLGYFCKDKDSSNEKMVFNKTVGLKDSWAKEEKK